MLEQNRVALQHDFTFLSTPADVSRFVAAGYLVPLRGNRNYELAVVSFPYVRLEARMFVERLSVQYRSACGEKLVVTSATRPRNRQPRNASPLSVHPAGMAMDFRVSRSARCRQWLEGTLLSLDGVGVLNVTREYYPSHYHVAIYPRPYTQYVQRVTRSGAATSVSSSSTSTSSVSGFSSAATHRVVRGEALSVIAHRYGVTVVAIQRANGLNSSSILAGQELRIPALVHRVRRGEALSVIAERYGVSVTELQRANNLSSPDQIREGQRLFVPGMAEHTVVQGDNLSRLADAYGTTVARIASANGLAAPYRVRVGDHLRIPVGARE
jgi:LysM repeat protein